MSLKYPQDVSFSLSVFFLKVVGFWLSTNRAERCLRNATVVYSFAAVFFSIWIQTRNLYFFWGDFAICGYVMCNLLGLLVDLLKMCVLSVHKEKFFNLIVYMQKNFWHSGYDQYENSVIADARRFCIYFVCVFSFFSQSTVFCYMFRPLLSNIGRNESDRAFIFNMWLDLPLTMTPYYEIIYVIQAATLYSVGVLYLCFDNIFCIMCLHVAGQFRILQYKLAKMPDSMDRTGEDTIVSSKECYDIFRDCIEQHKELVKFCTMLEETFRLITLGQVLLFSILLSFIGYQLIVVNSSSSWRVTFATFLMTNMCQLWMFTYSCDCVTRESTRISSAVYEGSWIYLPMDRFGKILRKDLQLTVMRSRRPCYLTALGFFPVSLETFTKITSTAMSYFTLMTQRTVDPTDT